MTSDDTYGSSVQGYESRRVFLVCKRDLADMLYTDPRKSRHLFDLDPNNIFKEHTLVPPSPDYPRHALEGDLGSEHLIHLRKGKAACPMPAMYVVALAAVFGVTPGAGTAMACM